MHSGTDPEKLIYSHKMLQLPDYFVQRSRNPGYLVLKFERKKNQWDWQHCDHVNAANILVATKVPVEFCEWYSHVGTAFYGVLIFM